MGRIAKGKTISKKILTTLCQEYNSIPDNDMLYFFISDDKTGQYLLYRDGWRNAVRYYGCLVHITVAKDGKVWLQLDNTDEIIAQKLLDAGIQKSELVLGFQPPMVRPDTGFAVA